MVVKAQEEDNLDLSTILLVYFQNKYIDKIEVKKITKKVEDFQKQGKNIGRERVRLTQPRVDPLEESEWNEEVREILKPMMDEETGQIINIHKTMARYPDLLRRWLVFARHILFKSSLPAREREILILRIGWLCQAEYEFGQHVIIGKESGLIDDEIQMIMEGPDSKGLSSFDATLLKAVDELYYDAFISDPTWKALSEKYNTQQLMDLVFAVGQYNLVSMALNTLGVQLEEGTKGFPK